MIVSVASCPSPPLLRPGLTGRPVAEVERLREGCLAAIAELLAAGPDRVVVVGGAEAAECDPPLSIAIGRLLLDQAGCRLPVQALAIPAASPPAGCLTAGQRLAAGADRTGLLVMADGSARRTLKAPGYLDGRAAPFDAEIERCLRSGRLAGLGELDPGLAAELLVAGRAAWQVLAGAVGTVAGHSRLHYCDDPFGVWYPVVSWLPAGS